MVYEANNESVFRQRLLQVIGGSKPGRHICFEVDGVALDRHLPLYQGETLIALLRPLPWESAVFQCTCQQLFIGIEPSNVTACETLAANTKQAQITWTRLATEHHEMIDRLQRQGFDPLLEMTNLEIPLQNWKPIPPDIPISLATPADAESVGQAAKIMFSGGRFHIDPHIKQCFADQAHAEWASNSVLGKTADRTLVAVDKNQIVGFHALKWLETKHGRTGITVLIGVSAHCRGRGFGKALLLAGLNLLHQEGAQQAWVRTESANTAARRLYQSVGFTTADKFWYLRRFNPSNSQQLP